MNKKIFIILFTTILFVNCKAQVSQTVHFKTLRIENPQNGVYFKDINHEFEYYIGDWTGILNNKKYTFKFVKFEQVYIEELNNSYYYQDFIKVKFKVIDLSNNEILYDDTNIVNIDDYKITNQTLISFIYNDSDNCNNSINFDIHKITNNPYQIKYCYFFYDGFGDLLNNCPYENQEDIPMFLPKQDLILTKQ